MKPEEVQKLAALARIKVEESQLPKFTEEFDAIVKYVGQLESLELPPHTEKPALSNVMREDGEPAEAGKYTEKLTAQFPARSSYAEAAEDKEGVYLEVKQIITHD